MVHRDIEWNSLELLNEIKYRERERKRRKGRMLVLDNGITILDDRELRK